MVNVSMKALLEAGVHFGHQTRRWNPKMAKYIFGARKMSGGKENIHILDLQKTTKELKRAIKYVREQIEQNKKILFIGTKKQAAPVVREEALKCGAYYVVERWLGGTLTNFDTLKRSLEKYHSLKNQKENGLFEKLSKKEASRRNKELMRFDKYLEGIKDMKAVPDLVFVVDPNEESTAVLECRRLNIPIVAVCDTNCDPELIDYPIPGNDDAIRAIQLFCSLVSSTVNEGKTLAQKKDESQEGAEGELAGQDTVSPEEESGIPESDINGRNE